MRSEHQPTTGLLFSGGLDSAVLLDYLLARGWRVAPFYVRSGCAWECCELTTARQFLAAVRHPQLMDLVLFDLPLDDLYGQHWSITGAGVPDETTSDDAVFLFGRNPLLLIKPALWCRLHGIGSLALATLASNPFDDASSTFFARFEEMCRAATGERLQILRPFDRLPKSRVMELGAHLPLELTFSCLSPINGLHCGRCNKCAERRRAFRHHHFADATRYADEASERVAGAIAAGKHSI
jgi:7-cyano-7-deazaguanine synthase